MKKNKSEKIRERISKLRAEYDDLLEKLDVHYEATSEPSHEMILVGRRLNRISTQLDPISGVKDAVSLHVIACEMISIRAELMRIEHLYV